MGLIPAWVKTLWNVWDVRILVLLSLTLQIILTIFGNRRRYISSLWLNVVIWSAYLAADWVATVALGKLSDAQSDDHDTNNALRAIWAPMLLLHLGGPDAITAYSLEDNQLWMRHLLGLVVQSGVAVYVIIMSLKNLWFSFLSFPALVAGIIKYGERTWVLKSVGDDKSGDVVPFSNKGDNPHDTVVDDKDLRNLVLATNFTKGFKVFMERYDLIFTYYSNNRLSYSHSPTSRDFYNMNLSWDATEVGISLMYDILYTKAVIIYSKVGCILRCVSVTCMMSVFVGILWFLSREDYKWRHDYNSSKVDIAITVSLLVGALALEIYAITKLISSDWAMLWLIKHKGAAWVIKLRQRFPRLFKKKKTWSKTMGQFDLLGFCIKDDELERRLSTRIVGWLLGTGSKDKFKRYMHTTSVSVPPHLPDMFSDFSNLFPNVVSRESIEEEDKIWKACDIMTDGSLETRLLSWHIITEMCYHLETECDTESWKQDKEICRVLSNYMMYLRFTCHSLLPDSILWVVRLEAFIDDIKGLIGETRDVSSSCRHLYEHVGDFKNIVEYLKKKQGMERWEFVKLVWLRMLFYAAGKGQRREHLQRLRQGGEFLTFLWFFLPQSRELRRVFTETARGIYKTGPPHHDYV